MKGEARTGVEFMVAITEWPFIGRSDELAAVSRLIEDPLSRGVVLAGPPGVGKSRLAAECLTLADRASDRYVARAAGHRASADLPFRRP